MAVTVQGQQVTFSPPPGAAALVGDFTDWRKRPPLPVQPGQPLTLTLPRGAWVEYAWLDASGTAFADPDNAQKSLNPWWPYPRAVEVGRYAHHGLWTQPDATRKGAAHRLTWEGTVFPGTRRAVVYTPHGHDVTRPTPVYYVQDGVAFYRTGKLGEVMDRAVEAGLASGAVLVFVEPGDRSHEYYLNGRYLDFLQREVFPRVEGEHAAVSERGLWGASLGGLISLYLGSRHPELFQRVVSHSGAFIARPGAVDAEGTIDTTTAGEWLREQLEVAPPRHLRVSLDTGVLEWLTAPTAGWPPPWPIWAWPTSTANMPAATTGSRGGKRCRKLFCTCRVSDAPAARLTRLRRSRGIVTPMRAALLTALSLLGPSLQGGAEALTMTYPHSSTLIHERAEDWAGAARQGVELRGDTLRLSPERSAGTLTSLPLTAPAFDELVPSWNAVTPGAGSVGVEVRVREGQHGGWSRWFSFGTWRSGEGRTSLNGQRDASGQVLTDTLRLGQKMKTYQYRVTLRGAGTELRLLALNTAERAARAAGLGQPGNPLNWGKVMNVPLRSQMLYPGGGEVWCSPTSVSMILAHHGVKVTVPQAAQGTFDRAYEGTGNWPFNTAYAASFGLRAFVTRLPSLAEAERYTAAGFPLAVSLGWKKGELPGVPLPVSEGHLMVLVGFDTEGNPVLNDPAAPTDAAVRRTYTRLAFERQWLTHSGGLSYVIAPQGARLP